MNTSLNSSLLEQAYCTPPTGFIDNYFEFSIIVASYGFTFFAGLTGNLLIIYIVAYFQRIRTLPNMFLVNLACADLLFIIVCVPIKCIQLFSFTWQFGKFLCKMVHYIQNVSAICSVYTLTVISIERYYGIIYPVQSRAYCSKQKKYWSIVAIWLASLVMAQPVVYIRIIYPVNCNAYYCIPDYDSYWIGYYETYMLLLILIFPTIILCYTYSLICYQLKIVIKTRSFLTIVSLENNDLPIESRKNNFEKNNQFNFNKKSNLKFKNELPNSFNKKKLKRFFNLPIIFFNKNSFHFKLNSKLNKQNKSENIKLKLFTPKNQSKLNYNQMQHETCIISNLFIDNSNLIENHKFINKPNHFKIKNSNKKLKTCSIWHESSIKKFNNLQRNYVDRKDDNTVKQVIKLLVAVVILFIICWSPILIFNLLKGLGIISRFNHGILRPISVYSHLLSYINSAINPLIYGFMSRHFQDSFRTIFTSIFFCKSSKYSKNQSILVKNYVPNLCTKQLLRKNDFLSSSNKL